MFFAPFLLFKKKANPSLVPPARSGYDVCVQCRRRKRGEEGNKKKRSVPLDAWSSTKDDPTDVEYRSIGWKGGGRKGRS